MRHNSLSISDDSMDHKQFHLVDRQSAAFSCDVDRSYTSMNRQAATQTVALGLFAGKRVAVAARSLRAHWRTGLRASVPTLVPISSLFSLLFCLYFTRQRFFASLILNVFLLLFVVYLSFIDSGLKTITNGNKRTSQMLPQCFYYFLILESNI